MRETAIDPTQPRRFEKKINISYFPSFLRGCPWVGMLVFTLSDHPRSISNANPGQPCQAEGTP